MLLPSIVEYFTTDEPWPFFLTFRIQSVFGFFSLAVNFIVAVYAFGADDCYIPHASLWRSQLVVDIMATAGFILDADSAFKFQEIKLLDPTSSSDASSTMVPTTNALPPTAFLQKQANPFKTALLPYSLDELVHNFTVFACTEQRPYLFVTLIARQWAALLVLFMGLERLLFVRYPLWIRSIRISVGPNNVFAVFFALFSAGIAYTNAIYVAAFEQTHFSCEASWAFGEDYGWFFYGIVIVPQLLGCGFCIIAYYMIHHEQALRRFGGNRQKLAGEKRKIRKIKWLLITCFAFVAVPQSLLFAFHVFAPKQLFLIKMLISQLFLAKCFGNILMYNRAVVSTRFGLFDMLKQKWDRRRKGRINPTELKYNRCLLRGFPVQFRDLYNRF
uniref:G-protein coupled receptors family 1 profile domain-containing protein n=1 Tax=Globodera rostochiensis TaxID=31243 RepID=A0A914IB29_GLORO